MVLSDLLECGSSSRSSCKKCLYSHFQKFNFCSSKSHFNVWKVKIGHCFTQYKRLFGVSLYEAAAGFLECLEWEARNAQKKNLVYYFTSLPSLFSSEEEAEGRASKVNGSKSCFGIETFPLSQLIHFYYLQSDCLQSTKEPIFTLSRISSKLWSISLISIQYSVASKQPKYCLLQI